MDVVYGDRYLRMVFFKLSGDAFPKTITKADQMFPYFLSTHLPQEVLGLLLAGLTGAAMSMVASDLNSLASVVMDDFYRAERPRSTDRERCAQPRQYSSWVS